MKWVWYTILAQYHSCVLIYVLSGHNWKKTGSIFIVILVLLVLFATNSGIRLASLGKVYLMFEYIVSIQLYVTYRYLKFPDLRYLTIMHSVGTPVYMPYLGPCILPNMGILCLVLYLG